MLSELRIRNFALIENLSVQLGPGLNVLTGETGAGKSIIVGALSLLLGERASAEVVRAGTERASVEGVFDIGGLPDVVAWLEEHGFEPEEGGVILKREVALEGRNRAWINGSPTTAALLGEIGGRMVSLHGQHQHQSLLHRDEQRAILDAFGGNGPLLAEVGSAHRSVTELTREIDRLEARRREALQRADFLRFQVAEIEAAELEAGEEERLDDEARRLSHAEELLSLASTVSRAISSGSDSASGRLGPARRSLDQLIRIDPSQQELAELYDTAYYALEELASRLDRYQVIVENDPVRLEEIRRRQDLLFRLRAKYGPTLDDVIATLAAAKAELGVLGNAEWEISELTSRRQLATDELMRKSAELTEQRKKAAARLQKSVDRVLPELGMEGGRFEAVCISLASPGPNGGEEIEFRVSLNRGFDPKPLATVASGGEMSRVMLALKTILAELDAVPTLIFDEVDAGVGGKVALQVGDKMREVARSHQVLAITHLPQIASRAHLHLLVAKESGTEKTSTSLRQLEAEERVAEIARMLGGDPESATSISHARELIEKGSA